MSLSRSRRSLSLMSSLISGNEAIGAGDEGKVEMLVNGVAGLQLQRRILDRRKQRRVIAVPVLGDAEL